MKHIYTFFCLFLISGVSSAEQWLCIGDQATGFVYNHKGSGTWTNVPIGGGKWIISHLEALPNIPYVVRKFGGDVSEEY